MLKRLGNMHPYKDISSGDNWVIREFTQDIDPIELLWHRDDEDRELELVEGQGWKIQIDNYLPIELTQISRINIKKHDYHRLIKGDGNLIVKIYKS
jgi:hypothetical protein